MSFQNGDWTINDWTISEFWCMAELSESEFVFQELTNTQAKQRFLNVFSKTSSDSLNSAQGPSKPLIFY
jgi:hypothetical protein